MHRIRTGAIALVAGLLLNATAFAQSHGGAAGGHAGGFSGGGHAAYGGRPGGYYGGRPGGYYGGRPGGYYGGRPGGYYGGGWHGGYGYGWRGGYYGGWRGYGGWGWGWGGLGYGLFFASLPLYYSTYWWGGVPYYYADDNYYIWNRGAGQYETVQPPAEVASQAGPGAAANTNLFAYPKNGQTAEQQSKDTFECHQWAAGQTGFDPTLAGSAPAATAGAGSAPAATASPGKQQDYMRAQAACLEGRGYSVQ
jgi:hypothetical protein